MNGKEILKIKYAIKEIQEKRSLISNLILNSIKNISENNLENITEDHIRILFKNYDHYFFDDHLNKLFIDNLKFSLSTRMYKSAGKTIYKKIVIDDLVNEEFEIRISTNVLRNFYKISSDKKVNGIPCTDVFTALQLIFEHELCHLIEFNIFKVSNCKGNRFKFLSYNYFGHTDIYHTLPIEANILSEKYHIKIGERICFKVDSFIYYGLIQKIGKNVTVMIEDKFGKYEDRKNNRYSKIRISIEQIIKIKE